MNRDLECVRLLEPEFVPPSREVQARERAALLGDIAAMTSPRRRRRSFALRAIVAAAVVTALGGGAAFALSQQLGPDPQQAARVVEQNEPAASAHTPGWRPELDAESVVCDYQHVDAGSDLLFSLASEFPLAQPLTRRRLVDECRTRTDAVRTQRIDAPALLCAVTPPGERRLVPVVVFAVSACDNGLVAAPATLLAERNELRRDEIAIRAVPQSCPTASESERWVRKQIDATAAPLHLLDVETHPGGRCWLPEVSWGRDEVRITALLERGSPGTSVPPAGS